MRVEVCACVQVCGRVCRCAHMLKWVRVCGGHPLPSRESRALLLSTRDQGIDVPEWPRRVLFMGRLRQGRDPQLWSSPPLPWASGSPAIM